MHLEVMQLEIKLLASSCLQVCVEVVEVVEESKQAAGGLHQAGPAELGTLPMASQWVRLAACQLLPFHPLPTVQCFS